MDYIIQIADHEAKPVKPVVYYCDTTYTPLISLTLHHAFSTPDKDAAQAIASLLNHMKFLLDDEKTKARTHWRVFEKPATTEGE